MTSLFLKKLYQFLGSMAHAEERKIAQAEFNAKGKQVKELKEKNNALKAELMEANEKLRQLQHAQSDQDELESALQENAALKGSVSWTQHKEYE